MVGDSAAAMRAKAASNPNLCIFIYKIYIHQSNRTIPSDILYYIKICYLQSQTITIEIIQSLAVYSLCERDNSS